VWSILTASSACGLRPGKLKIVGAICVVCTGTAKSANSDAVALDEQIGGLG
jgi:hypothetical protein